MKDNTFDHNLCLSQEEALGLLEIVLMSPGELTPEQRSAVVKLSDLCRACLRDEVSEIKEVTPRGVECTFPTAYAA